MTRLMNGDQRAARTRMLSMREPALCASALTVTGHVCSLPADHDQAAPMAHDWVPMCGARAWGTDTGPCILSAHSTVIGHEPAIGEVWRDWWDDQPAEPTPATEWLDQGELGPGALRMMAAGFCPVMGAPDAMLSEPMRCSLRHPHVAGRTKLPHVMAPRCGWIDLARGLRCLRGDHALTDIDRHYVGALPPAEPLRVDVGLMDVGAHDRLALAASRSIETWPEEPGELLEAHGYAPMGCSVRLELGDVERTMMVEWLEPPSPRVLLDVIDKLRAIADSS